MTFICSNTFLEVMVYAMDWCVRFEPSHADEFCGLLFDFGRRRAIVTPQQVHRASSSVAQFRRQHLVQRLTSAQLGHHCRTRRCGNLVGMPDVLPPIGTMHKSLFASLYIGRSIRPDPLWTKL
jgi:hypothetical protein